MTNHATDKDATSAQKAAADLQASAPSSMEAARREARRRFLIGGGAVPVALTLSGRTAFADACTYSGAMSGNLSNQRTGSCAKGFSPGYWKAAYDRKGQNHLQWPVPLDTLYADPANGVGIPLPYIAPAKDQTYDPASMRAALDNGHDHAHFAAAILNSYTVPGYPYDPITLRKLIRDYYNGSLPPDAKSSIPLGDWLAQNLEI